MIGLSQTGDWINEVIVLIFFIFLFLFPLLGRLFQKKGKPVLSTPKEGASKPPSRLKKPPSGLQKISSDFYSPLENYVPPFKSEEKKLKPQLGPIDRLEIHLRKKTSLQKMVIYSEILKKSSSCQSDKM